MAENKVPEKKNADGDLLDAMMGAAKEDGVTVPSDDNINIDSYMENIPEEMRGMFMKMRKMSVEKTKGALGSKDVELKPVDPKAKSDSGYSEVVIDEEERRKMRIAKAAKHAKELETKNDSEYDAAIEAEKERLKELDEHPENDPNFGGKFKPKADKEEPEEKVEEETGTILGDSYVKKEEEKPEESDFDDLKTDEFLPDFDDDEDEAEKKEPAEKEDEDDNIEDASELEIRYRNEDELEKMIRETVELKIEPDPAPIVRVSQKRTEVIEVPGNNSDRVKELTDDAFITRFNKIRRKNFRVVEVPLLNSGFVVSMNGISAGDLIALYTIVDQHSNGGISAMDYLNAQMKTIAKSIVKIHPHFDKSNLHYMIHYADLNMLMYGIVAATLDDAKYPIDACEGCGKSFRITIPSTDIILNKDEIQARAEEIYNATDIKNTSLLERNVVMKFPSGFEVVLGHASIADQRALMQAIDRYSENSTMLTEIDKMALLEAATTELPWIKSLLMPGNIKAKGPYQITKGLGLMDDDERRQIVEVIRKLQKDLVPTKIGVRNVRCPHCGHIHEQIPISSLSALVFYHKRESSAFATTKNEKEN